MTICQEDFIDRCRQLQSMLLLCAKQDLDEGRAIQTMIALAGERGGGLFIDAQALTWKGKHPVPAELGVEETLQVFLGTAMALGEQHHAVVVKVDLDLRLSQGSAEGLTERARTRLRSMPIARALRTAGAQPLLVIEFLSAGALWHARSTHPIAGRGLEQHELVTAHLGGLEAQSSLARPA